MASAEQIPVSNTAQRFLELATKVCLQEVAMIEPSTKGSNAQRWVPKNLDIFNPPISLDPIEWTSQPQRNNNFRVTAATFHILGEDAMSLHVAADFRPRQEDNPFDSTLNNDPWAQMIWGLFQSAYEGHIHERCLAIGATTPKKMRLQIAEPYKLTDKRNGLNRDN